MFFHFSQSKKQRFLTFVLCQILLGFSSPARTQDHHLELGRSALKKMTGCFLVDYRVFSA